MAASAAVAAGVASAAVAAAVASVAAVAEASAADAEKGNGKGEALPLLFSALHMAAEKACDGLSKLAVDGVSRVIVL